MYLYGTTGAGGAHDGGVIYRLDTDGNNFSVIHDFEFIGLFGRDRSLLQDSAGTLYGLAGLFDRRLPNRPNGSNYSVIHPFAAGGGQPGEPDARRRRLLYGTTEDPQTCLSARPATARFPDSFTRSPTTGRRPWAND